MPGTRFPKLRQNLNKFYELCGENDSQAGRRLGIKPQQFNEWRKGDDGPTRAAREHIAARLGVSVRDLLHGDIADAAAARDGPRLSNKAQKLLRNFEQLLEAAEKTKNQRVLQHFDFECIEKAVCDKGDKTREGKTPRIPTQG